MVPSQDCFSGWFFPGSVHAGNGTIQAQHQRTDPLSFREDGFKEDVFKEDGFKDGSSVASSKSSATRWVENLNNAVFFADDEFDDSASGNRAASSSSEDPVRSLGAHLRGTCQPCVFNATTAGCSKGDYCGYCHFDHPMTMLNRRVRKRTRDKIKRRLLEIFNPPVDLEEVHELLQTEAARHIFARTLSFELPCLEGGICLGYGSHFRMH
ncbi:unnamed protein product, partial [Cladocopium goreaui]